MRYPCSMFKVKAKARQTREHLGEVPPVARDRYELILDRLGTSCSFWQVRARARQIREHLDEVPPVAGTGNRHGKTG